MTLRKKDLVEMLYLHMDLPKPVCGKVVNTVFEIIQEKLSGGDEVRISGFGKWHLLKKDARRGRNPQTGAGMTLRARKVVKFKSSNVLRKELQEE